MAQLVFSRKELKYMVSPDVFPDFLAEIRENMVADKYGEYTICNMYYDTEDFNIIRMSMDKPLYKEKLRLRSYGIPKQEDRVFVEIKKKYDGMVYKRRETLSYAEACAFLNEGVYPVEKDSQIMRELQYFCDMHHPKPALFLAYDRMAFAEKDGGALRLTFDSNIRYRFEQVDFSHGMEGKLLLDPALHLMEIKGAAAMPLWLTALLDKYAIHRISFSKYGRIYAKEFENLQEAQKKHAL